VRVYACGNSLVQSGKTTRNHCKSRCLLYCKKESGIEDKGGGLSR